MITVILPVRNGGALLKRCLESLARQDAETGAFDLVVLDNCSTDGSLDALRQLPDQIPRRVITAERSLTIEENWARIRELTEVRPFITATGHDDMFDPHFIRTMSSVLRQQPDVRVLFSHFRLIDVDDQTLRPCRPMAASETAGQFLAGRMAQIRDSFGTGYVMRFDDYRSVGGIPAYEKLMWADDALWLRLAQRSPIRILEEQTFSYRLHATSTSNVTNANMILNSLSAYVDLLVQLAAHDAGIHRALAVYGLDFVVNMARHWMLEESNRANRQGAPAPLEYMDAWRTVCRRLYTAVGRADELDRGNRDFSQEMAFSLWANRHPVRRQLWNKRPVRWVMRALHKTRGV